MARIRASSARSSPLAAADGCGSALAGTTALVAEPANGTGTTVRTTGVAAAATAAAAALAVALSSMRSWHHPRHDRRERRDRAVQPQATLTRTRHRALRAAATRADPLRCLGIGVIPFVSGPDVRGCVPGLTHSSQFLSRGSTHHGRHGRAGRQCAAWPQRAHCSISERRVGARILAPACLPRAQPVAPLYSSVWDACAPPAAAACTCTRASAEITMERTA